MAQRKHSIPRIFFRLISNRNNIIKSLSEMMKENLEMNSIDMMKG